MNRINGKRVRWIGLMSCAIVIFATSAFAVRVKDVTQIQGVRENQLLGYGLVVGLNGTGDGTDSDFTAQSLANFLRRNNIQVEDPTSLKLKNVAAVIVTAELSAFAKPGDTVDVSVNSIGDAKTLQGGTLLMTPLYSAIPNEVYAVAQGAISTGGFRASAGGNTVSKNHGTAGKIPGGAIIEKPSPVVLEGRTELHLRLFDPDFTTAQRIAEVINANQGPGTARAVTSAEVSVKIPAPQLESIPEFLAHIERLPVHPDQRARIIIDERTGTVVMGEDVRIATLALTHGSLTIQVSQVTQVSQPEGFSQGQTTAVKNTGISAQEETDVLQVVDEGVSVGEVVKSLNALGLTPRDLIAILQSIKSAGALQAELVIK